MLRSRKGLAATAGRLTCPRAVRADLAALEHLGRSAAPFDDI